VVVGGVCSEGAAEGGGDEGGDVLAMGVLLVEGRKGAAGRAEGRGRRIAGLALLVAVGAGVFELFSAREAVVGGYMLIASGLPKQFWGSPSCTAFDCVTAHPRRRPRPYRRTSA
jgi:hypothetical protein